MISRRNFLHQGAVASALVATLGGTAVTAAAETMDSDDIEFFIAILEHVERTPPRFTASFAFDRDVFWYVANSHLATTDLNEVKRWRSVFFSKEDGRRLRAFLADRGVFPLSFCQEHAW